MYMDYAATTPMTNEALAMYHRIATDYYGNSSSLHDCGGHAKQVLEQSRKMIAQSLGVSAEGIYFTSGGTEGNIVAIMSIALAQKGKHIITSVAEHTSVHAAMNALERQYYSISRIPLTDVGIIDIEKLASAIQLDTALISIQYINSETGIIQPIEAIAALAKKHHIKLHVDCVQAYCKLPLEQIASQVDAVTVTSHKIGGPKGVGAIYIAPDCPTEPLYPGVTHERGLRGGTVDVPAICSFAVAAQYCLSEEALAHLHLLRKCFTSEASLLNLNIIEYKAAQYPGILGMMVKGIEGQLMMLKLNEQQIFISTGSACDSQHEHGTKAVLSMGYSPDEVRQFFRVSLHEGQSIEEVKEVVRKMHVIIKNT